MSFGGTKADRTPLERAFAELGAPFAAVSIPDERPREIYGHDLLLLRPDLHVVWRGNRLPDEPRKVAEIATGHQARDGLFRAVDRDTN